MLTRTSVPSAVLLLFLGVASSGCSSAVGAQQATPPYQLLVLRMSASESGQQVIESTLVASSAPLVAPPQSPDARAVNFAVTDASGKVVFESSLPDPNELRSPLSPPGAPFEGHKTVKTDGAEYLLRMPYLPEARMLRIAVGAPVVQPSAQGATPAPPPGAQNTVIDLGPWISRAKAKAPQP